MLSDFIDLLAILPWWANKLYSGADINVNSPSTPTIIRPPAIPLTDCLWSQVGSPILRMFRMVRVFRILKFGGHVRNLRESSSASAIPRDPYHILTEHVHPLSQQSRLGVLFFRSLGHLLTRVVSRCG